MESNQHREPWNKGKLIGQKPPLMPLHGAFTAAGAASRQHLEYPPRSRASSTPYAMRLDCCLNKRRFARGRR